MAPAARMLAQRLHAPRQALRGEQLEVPRPGHGQVLLEVRACALCRTDLHLIDGELTPGHLPLTLGHEIVGEVVERGPAAERFQPGERVGVPWLGWTCGACRACMHGRENLCPRARFTGRDLDGGFAQLAVVDERYALRLPEGVPDAEVAPLLCAGLIGFRALRAAGEAERLGLYGFGAAAHVVAQIARHQGRRVFAFTREGDASAQELALELGAEWAGPSSAAPPVELDAALIFAPVGALVPLALRAVAPGGTVVCGGIHMSPLPAMPYELLWGERVLRSVANLTRRDGEELLALAPRAGVRTRVTTFPLAQANAAVDALRAGAIVGAAVLLP